MNDNADIWCQYYEKSLFKIHSKSTEFAVSLNTSASKVAIDCGCGTGSDINYLEKQQYQVYAFDINADSIAICKQRFSFSPLVHINQASFESFNYPKASIVLANSSLFFAEPLSFLTTWQKIALCLDSGGGFSGDFMG